MPVARSRAAAIFLALEFLLEDIHPRERERASERVYEREKMMMMMMPGGEALSRSLALSRARVLAVTSLSRAPLVIALARARRRAPRILEREGFLRPTREVIRSI